MFEPSGKLVKQQNVVTISLLSNIPDKLIDLITPAKSLTHEDAVEFYYKEYRSKLKRALSINYSVSLDLYPNELDVMINDFIKVRTSNSYNLNDYCNLFPDYLASSRWKKQYPQVFAIVNLEQCFNKLNNQAPKKGLNQDEISQLGISEDITVDFIDNLYLFDNEYPIYDWWKNQSLDTSKKGNAFFIYKVDKDVNIFNLSNFQYQIVLNMILGETIEKSITQAKSNLPDEKKKNEINVLFSFLSTNRLIAGLHY